MIEESIQFSFKGRYFILGDPRTASSVWFVLHGYGQLARFFLRKFSILEKKGIAVIAPEGLSRFYLEETSKRVQSGNFRVGATWMTRENREADIENYLNFLDKIYTKEMGLPSPKITVLGFSQGAATASRWVAHNAPLFDRLILWAGIFPPDMVLKRHEEFERIKIVSVVGKLDALVNEDKANEMRSICNQLNITPHTVTFDGGHEIDEATLMSLI